MFLTLVTVTHIFICFLLIGIVLLQQGKGADVGATFGGGSNTLFGASGADTLLTKVTTTLAVLFMVTSVILASDTKIALKAGSDSIFGSGDFDEVKPVESAPAEADKNSNTEQPASPAAKAEDTKTQAQPGAEAVVVDTTKPPAEVPAETAPQPQAN